MLINHSNVHNKGMAELSLRQERFVAEYLKDGNGTQAAIRAGYKPAGAHVQANSLLRNPKVSAKLDQVKGKTAKRMDITAERVLTEIARLAFLDPRQAFDSNGRLLDIKQMPDEVAASLASVEVEEQYDREGNHQGTTKKVKFWDKGRALEQLCKHLGLTRDKIELTGKDGGPIEVATEDREAKLQAFLKTIEARVTDAVHSGTDTPALDSDDTSGAGGT